MTKSIAKKILFCILRILPKFDHAVVYGWPDFEDSSLALERALNETSLTRIFFFVNGETQSPFPLSKKTRVIQKDSLNGIFRFLFTKYVFFTHRCFLQEFPPNVVSVNVWHGMPIKRIGWMLPDNRGIDSQYALATSDFWAPIIQKSMRPFGKVLITGLPRNDRLFSSENEVRKKLGISADSEIKKIIAWLPTYRKSVRGELRSDGDESGNVFGMDGLDPEMLNAFFKKINALAVIKPHPMAPFDGVGKFSNLLIVDDAWLREKRLSLYKFLGGTDLLISDISSVVVDYLILNRPVIHCFPDMAAYENSRGFSFSPISDYFVGPVASNPEELFRALGQFANGERDASSEAQRLKIQKLFHQDCDGQSAARLLSALNLG